MGRPGAWTWVALAVALAFITYALLDLGAITHDSVETCMEVAPQAGVGCVEYGELMASYVEVVLEVGLMTIAITTAAAIIEYTSN